MSKKHKPKTLIQLGSVFFSQALIFNCLFTPSVFSGTEKASDQPATSQSAQTSSRQVESGSESQDTREPAEATEPSQLMSENGLTQTAASSFPGNVTIDFKDADIQNVLRILSYKSGVNIVAGKDVTGIVTIRLVDVPWEKALDVVLKTYGYAYDRDGSIIRVTTIENLKKEELSTEVYVLNYSQASEVEKALKDVLSDRGKVRSDARSNMIIVTDMPTTLQQVKKVIERLDKITPQVVIEAKIIETTLGDSEQMGIKWNVSASLSGSRRPTTLPFPARQTSEWSRFMPEGTAPKTEVVTNSTTGAIISTSTTSDFPVNAPASVPNFPVAVKDAFTFGTLDFTQFQALLQMIKNRTDTKILSEPHVTTLNNMEANILVGEVINLPKFERNSQTGKMEITDYLPKNLGIELQVTPQINNQDEIVVRIKPKVTSLLGYDVLTADIKAPHFAERSADTVVRIRNGETIAIGGLIKENIVDSNNKVPLLGDIPLFGKIFNHKDKTVQKTDLLFFMTVNIVSEKTDWDKGHSPKP